MDALGDPALKDPVSPFVQLLWERGSLFERETINGLGEAFTDLSGFAGDEKERQTRTAIARADALIYSGRLTVDELLGEPDLLRREGAGYVAIDIKSGAGREGADEEAAEEGKLKKPYGVQLALYTDILIRLGVAAGRYGYIWDVHGRETRYELDRPLGPRSPCMWESYLTTRSALQRSLADPASSRPAAAVACKLCVWRTSCLEALSQARDLTLLPELGRVKRDALVGQFATLDDLAAGNVERFCHGEKKTDFAGIGPPTLRKFQRRAALAVAAQPVPYLTRPVLWPSSAIELFFDIETQPMRDLCYLHGFVIRDGGAGGPERFEGIFAEETTPAAEQAAIVHYSKYERTEYRKLQRKYPQIASAEEIEALFLRPRALDLYFDVVKPGSEWPTRDFTVKSLAKCCGFQWRDTDPSGASSIEWFERWVKTGDPALKQRLLDYNQDDCVAMRVVMDAMKGMRVHAP